MKENDIFKKIDEYAIKKSTSLRNIEKMINDELKIIAEEIANES